jgi:hypothetical protein
MLILLMLRKDRKMGISLKAGLAGRGHYNETVKR